MRVCVCVSGPCDVTLSRGERESIQQLGLESEREREREREREKGEREREKKGE